MKTSGANSRCGGFSLFEVLLVIAVVAILAALLLPAKSGGGRSTYIQCISNQKQLALGIIMFSADNSDQYPWQLSVATNGTRELITNGLAAAQFRVLEPYLKSFGVYVCPTDRQRQAAASYAAFANTNLSYFINVDAATNLSPADVFLTGDRHLAVHGKPVRPGLFTYATNLPMDWSGELHHVKNVSRGGVSFLDGHVESVQSAQLNWKFQQQGLGTERLLVP